MLGPHPMKCQPTMGEIGASTSISPTRSLRCPKMTEIYYARHVHDWAVASIEGSTIDHFFREMALAIHFKGIESWEPNDYRGEGNQGPSAIRYMNRCNQGGDIIIFASYKTSEGERVLMGRPRPGSKRFLSESPGADGGPPVAIKMIFLDEVREITPDEFPYVSLLAPKQSTFVHWKQCEWAINRWLKNPELRREDLLDPRIYLPASIEVLCEEYLREPDLRDGRRREAILTRKITRTGSNLKFFDIIGIDTNGEQVYAQVKERSNPSTVKTFKQRCQDIGPGRYFFFAEELGSADVPGVEIVSIREVLEFFLSMENGRDYLETVAKQAWPKKPFNGIGTPVIS